MKLGLAKFSRTFPKAGFPLRDFFRALGWNELKIYSIFTVEYRFAREKSPSGKPA